MIVVINLENIWNHSRISRRPENGLKTFTVALRWILSDKISLFGSDDNHETLASSRPHWSTYAQVRFTSWRDVIGSRNEKVSLYKFWRWRPTVSGSTARRQAVNVDLYSKSAIDMMVNSTASMLDSEHAGDGTEHLMNSWRICIKIPSWKSCWVSDFSWLRDIACHCHRT